MTARPQKITMAQLRASGVRGLLVYCNDFTCSHSLAISGDPWPDDMRLSDLEPRFRCTACGKRGADVRPDFSEQEAGRDDGIPLKQGDIAVKLCEPFDDSKFSS